MEKSVNNIKIQIDELFDVIKSSNAYNDYQKVKQKLSNNNKIMNLIDEIKRYQKIYVNTKDKSLKVKIEEKQNELLSYPIYQSYLIAKQELNNELFEVKDMFEKYFGDILNI